MARIQINITKAPQGAFYFRCICTGLCLYSTILAFPKKYFVVPLVSAIWLCILNLGHNNRGAKMQGEIQQLLDGQFRVYDFDGGYTDCETRSEAEKLKREFEIKKNQKCGLMRYMLNKMAENSIEEKSVQTVQTVQTIKPK